jgi:hypothetical protein
VNGYPRESARYKITERSRRVYIPIPEGHSLWVGLHGSAPAGTGGFAVTPIRPGDIPGAAVFPPLLPLTTLQRVNAEFSGAEYRGIELSLEPGTAREITMTALIVVVTPIGIVPAEGEYVSGSGHSGCEFDGAPVIVADSAALDRISMSAKLIEVGDSR